MSLLELFKSHVQPHFAHHHSMWERNQLAEFYSGFYHKSMGVHIFHDLKECMDNDDEALYMWGKAIEHLAHGEQEQYKIDSERATELSKPLMEACKANNKFNIVSAEVDAWFIDFWTQPDAVEQMIENIREHPILVKLDITLARMAWKLGFYHGAGAAFGRFWTRLMGQPTWSADLNSIYPHPVEAGAETNDKVGKKDASAVFLSEAWHGFYPNQDIRSYFLDCFARDTTQYDAIDAVVGYISTDTSFLAKNDFKQAMKTMKQINRTNFQPCTKDPVSSQAFYIMLEMQKEATKFFTTPGVERQV
mmetsp:Transcript_1833/g.2605  ORF Transcript_1833/g.2605 Transcript_1833/m.2605 type:complete len:305 (-) Transcript_1833:187-1101(-)